MCFIRVTTIDRIIKLCTNFNCAKLKFALSTLAKQMTPYTVVVESHCASRPANMCFSSQIAMDDSVALFTHCRAVQLSAMSS